VSWHGVFPAITTPFAEDLSVDHALLARHASWMLESGCTGLVALGSLGEGAALSREEKLAVLRTCAAAIGGSGAKKRAPLLAGIAALSTADAVALARSAQEAGADGLMVLPPWVYRGDAHETLTHLGAVLAATPLPAMLYNNPIAYGTDVLPGQVAQLAARHSNLVAIKESSGDVRRITQLRAALGNRLALFVGIDDMLVEGVAAGAVGWVAGLVNAFPAESVRLLELARTGAWDEARALYEWFLPLLRLDTVPKFVQEIKLVQAEVGWGSERVRPPRLPLGAAEGEATRAVLRLALLQRQTA